MAFPTLSACSALWEALKIMQRSKWLIKGKRHAGESGSGNTAPPSLPTAGEECNGDDTASSLSSKRGSCESRVSDPSQAAQGDLAKRAVDEVGDHTSGPVFPVAALEALLADRSLLSAVRHELFGAARKLPPCPDDEANRRGHRTQQGQYGARRPVPHVLDVVELAVRLACLGLVVRRHLGRTDACPDVSRMLLSRRGS